LIQEAYFIQIQQIGMHLNSRRAQSKLVVDGSFRVDCEGIKDVALGKRAIVVIHNAEQFFGAA
jgi:hypothetical protein